jgi:Putative Flp pilus-assembly TadE/G-like
MKRPPINSRRQRNAGNKEDGIIIILVAVFLLFVVGAMAALSIDITTFYTARSEAQIAADSAALAAARVLANSGMTSDTSANASALITNAEALATRIATQVAQQDQIGGAAATTVNVTYAPCTQAPIQNNPCVTVKVQRTDLPAFFARIWGTTQVQVSATAVAEAYNPWGLASGTSSSPVATTCVKPWVLPNMDPSTAGTPAIFSTTDGTILTTSLLGWDSAASGTNLYSTDPVTGTPTAWQYYPSDQTSFPAPAPQTLSSCAAGLSGVRPDYQQSVAGCVQVPIYCGGAAGTSTVNLEANYPTRDQETADAVNCLTHTLPNTSGGDTILVNPKITPGQPFQFFGGNNNPIPGAINKNIMVSDSLVTVPVYDHTANGGGPPGIGNTARVIGFVQLFVNSDGLGTPDATAATAQIKTTVVNLIGCGSGAIGPPVFGNGPSSIAVRLVSPQ